MGDTDNPDASYGQISGRPARRVDPVLLAGFGFLALSLTVGFFGYRASHPSFDLNLFLVDYYANLSTELGSIAIVIIVVDRLNKRQERRTREEAHLKQQVLHDLRTSDDMAARKAFDILVRRGWLWDGSLQDASFAHANLRGAAMFVPHRSNAAAFRLNNRLHASLRGADFRYADLRGALLSHADLRDANLKDAMLEGAEISGILCNENTILPDDTLWNSNTDLAKFTDPSHPAHWRPAADRHAKT